jgi:hypothetical protein
MEEAGGFIFFIYLVKDEEGELQNGGGSRARRQMSKNAWVSSGGVKKA